MRDAGAREVEVVERVVAQPLVESRLRSRRGSFLAVGHQRVRALVSRRPVKSMTWTLSPDEASSPKGVDIPSRNGRAGVVHDLPRDGIRARR